MNDTSICSRGSPWRRVHASDVAAAGAAFTSGGLNGQTRRARTLPNLYADSGDLKVIDLRGDAGPGGQVANHIMVKPFGGNTDDFTFNLRLWGIEEGIGPVGTTDTASWDATLLAEVAVTLCSAAGAAGSLVEAADLYADTLALTYGITADNLLFTGATNVRGAWFRSDLLGFQIVAFEFEEGTATLMNALYRLLW